MLIITKSYLGKTHIKKCLFFCDVSDSSNDRSDNQGHICTPVSNMCLQTTICAAFKDFIFSGTQFLVA